MIKKTQLDGTHTGALSYLADKLESEPHSKDGYKAFMKAIFTMSITAFGSKLTQKDIFDKQRYFYYDITMRYNEGKTLTVTEREIILKALDSVQWATFMN